MTEWQPIETCPSQGERVLVIGGRHDEAVIVKADGEWWRRMTEQGSRSQPTHWMPLPDPPVETM